MRVEQLKSVGERVDADRPEQEIEERLGGMDGGRRTSKDLADGELTDRR